MLPVDGGRAHHHEEQTSAACGDCQFGGALLIGFHLAVCAGTVAAVGHKGIAPACARLIDISVALCIGEACEVSVDSQGRISVNSELWDRIGAKPGDEICVFNDDGKLDICTKNFYDSEDHDLSSIEGLETKYYVEGL